MGEVKAYEEELPETIPVKFWQPKDPPAQSRTGSLLIGAT